jgi:hypothetical protein
MGTLYSVSGVCFRQKYIGKCTFMGPSFSSEAPQEITRIFCKSSVYFDVQKSPSMKVLFIFMSYARQKKHFVHFYKQFAKTIRIHKKHKNEIFSLRSEVCIHLEKHWK